MAVVAAAGLPKKENDVAYQGSDGKEMVNKILQRQSRMEGERSTYDSHWQEISDFYYPRNTLFTTTQSTAGEKKTSKIMDSTPINVIERAASILMSLSTPSGQRWHRLRKEDIGNQDEDNVGDKRYFDNITNVLFSYRYQAKANFADNQQENILSKLLWGPSVMFVDGDKKTGGLRYRSIHIGQIWVDVNYQGIVDTVHYKFKYTARQAYQMFGDDMPASLLNLAKDNPDKELTFIHCVSPNDDIDTSRRDKMGMAYRSYYVCIEESCIVSDGGYRTMPYIFDTFMTSIGEKYGRSIAMNCLPDVKTLNSIRRDIITASQLSVRPPVLLSDDGVLTKMQVVPGALNVGALDDQGRPKAMPMTLGANPNAAMPLIENIYKNLNEAFFISLFQILVESPNMTATETMQRAQERGMLIAPFVSRQQASLAYMIERELDVLQGQGLLPPPETEEQSRYSVVFEAPINRLIRAEDANAAMRTIEAIAPMAQIDPSIISLFNIPEIGRVIADANGVPGKVIYSKQELEQREAAKQQEQQLQQLVNAAPQVAGSIRDIAQANKLQADANRPS